MEWDFTTSQVIKGEVDYTITQFFKDLEGEIEYNFPTFTTDQKKSLSRMSYSVVYLTAIHKKPQEIQELSKIPVDLITSLLAHNEANIRMLEAIVMRMFLDQFKKFNGLIGDSIALELVNLKLKKIHQTNFLNHD